MPKTRSATAVVLFLGGMLIMVGCANGSTVTPRMGHPDHRTERDARTWAATRMGAGAAGGSLIEARGDLHRNDFGVSPSLAWQLSFRSDRPVAPEELARTLRQACGFPLAREHGETRILATLAARGADTLVPTALGIGCDDPIDRVVRRFRHLGAHPYPNEVLESHISIVGDRFDVYALASVRRSDDASTVVDRVSQYLCAYPGPKNDIVHLRLAERRARTTVPEIHCELLA